MSNGIASLRIIVQRHPNPTITTYHVDQWLSDYGFSRSLTAELEGIPGVVKEGKSLISKPIRIEGYEISVERGVAFTDEEVEAGVLASIAGAFGLTVNDCAIKYEGRGIAANDTPDEETSGSETPDPESSESEG